VWPHRPQIRLPSTHFGLLIGAKSTLGALLIPLFGQFQKDNSRNFLFCMFSQIYIAPVEHVCYDAHLYKRAEA
jgi:hypothetical protein